MRLFFREQRPLIFVYFAQLFVITLIYRLAGFRSLEISLYAGLVSGCLLIGYLVFRYVANRPFYKRLEQPFGPADPQGGPFSGGSLQTPLGEALQQVLRNQFRQYSTELHNYKHRIDSHLQFINQWAHQMKTPISVMHLILQKKDDPDSMAIGDELDRLKKGLELMLHTARLDTFEHDFYVESLPLEQVVRSAASEQKRLFIRRRIFPAIDIQAGLSVTSDEKWLSFVLSQLMTNAVRYTPGEQGKVFFHGYRRDTDVILEIRDEGIGIPPGDLPRVFEPYFTGENGRRYQESTGMGLYLVQQICGKLGHGLDIQSSPGQGTTVSITFRSA